MVLDFIRKYLPPDNVPNNFTISMGHLIKSARKQAGFTQKELAEYSYIPQSTLSKMENGKVEPSASELVYLSSALDKPINYFFPNRLINKFDSNDKEDELLNELLLLGRKLEDRDLHRITAQIRAIIKIDEN